jgi:hypothetical protein
LTNEDGTIADGASFAHLLFKLIKVHIKRVVKYQGLAWPSHYQPFGVAKCSYSEYLVGGGDT